MIPQHRWRDIADAIGCTVILTLFCVALLTAPVWGGWLDALGDESRECASGGDDAQRHAAAYERVRGGK